jgi:hypothetical protein
LLELLLPPAVTLDIVENDAAAAASNAQLALTRLSDTEVGAIISEAAVRAFVAAGRIDEAERLLSSTHNFAGPAREPYLERAVGAIALAAGRPADAIGVLERATATFARAKSLWEELWTRLLLARARAAAGDAAAAADDLANASADAERSGIRLIARISREIHTELNLPGPERETAGAAPSPPGDDATDSEASGGTVSVVARASGARTSDRWQGWGEREAQRLHGVVDGAPGAVTAAFASAGAEDAWTNALRFALGLRDKGRLLGMPVSAGVAATAADAIRLLAATASHDILASEEMSTGAREWLDARQLIDSDPVTGRSVRLRARVTTSRPAPAAAPKAAEAAPMVQQNELVLEGDFWSVRYAGRTVRLKDTKGFHDIARLLATGGTEVAAVDLIGAHIPAGASLSGMPEQGFGVERDAGGVLDPEAREQYRSRLRELDLELEDAAAAHDPVREERARDEREFLLAELRSAVGLHGRTRRAIDPSERARKAVTWRIRDAITRAEAVHPPFGHHLRRSVRTGTLCVYDPPEPTSWTFVSRSEPSP